MMMELLGMLWPLADAVSVKETSGEVSTITTGALSAVCGGIVTVLVIYFKSRSKVTVDGEVSVTECANPANHAKKGSEVNWTEVRDLKERVSSLERQVEEARTTQGRQFAVIMESQHQSELRWMEKIDKSMAALHKRIDEMLRLMATEKIK